MDKYKFKALPSLPSFSDYNMNKIAEIGRRAVAIHDDALACLEILAANAQAYAKTAQDVFDMVVAGKVRSEDDAVFTSLEFIFAMLEKQFSDLYHRYDNLEQNNHTDAFARVSLTNIDNTYSLGIYNEKRSNNHPEVIKDQAAFIFESNEIPEGELDYDAIMDELEKSEKLREDVRLQREAKRYKTAMEQREVIKNVAEVLTTPEQNKSQFQFVKSDKTFKDVAGLKEVKEDLMQIVDFIKRPEVYKEFGAKLPKGTILYGPPGTGKTLLARAVAGEAGANFIALASTDFTAKTWGAVPAMIKELFAVANKYAPCIIFIDEIDMLGLNRGADKANSLAHRESLNAFLSAMDGFNQYEGVTVMAATNRLEDLDPAMTRPGRFDNLFSVPLPNNVGEVEEVVQIYMKNKRFDESVDSKSLARKFLRRSPAEIENILNEACLIAIKKNGGVIRESDVNEATLKKTIKGHVRENAEVPESDVKLVSIHEAGHALVAVVSDIPVQSVTIMGTTNGAGGLTMMEPSNKHYYRKSDYEKNIRIAYAGRAAEQLAYGEDMVTTGASADIRNATNLIKGASANYGFNLCDTQNHAPIVYKTISQANLEKAANKYYKETLQILKENVVALKEIACELLENGTITGERVKEIYEENKGKEIQMEF